MYNPGIGATHTTVSNVANFYVFAHVTAQVLVPSPLVEVGAAIAERIRSP